MRSEKSRLDPLIQDVKIYFDFEAADGRRLGSQYVDTRDLVGDVDDAVHTLDWESAETVVVAKPGFNTVYRVVVPSH